MILAIVGSQKGFSHGDYVTVMDTIHYFINGNLVEMRELGSTDPLIVLSGGCATGVDSWAEQYARNTLGLLYEEEAPSQLCWSGPGGFKDRNLKIAGGCDRLLCIRSRNSKTYGSGWTADRAEELGKKVWRIMV